MKAAESQAAPSSQPAAGRVLVVDDEAMVLMFVENALTRAGFEVWTANSGAEALAIARIHGAEISVVVLDLSMPGMNGEETLRRLRANGLTSAIIVSTGHGDVDAHRRLGALSVSGFLHKPYPVRNLVAAVAQQCAASPVRH